MGNLERSQSGAEQDREAVAAELVVLADREFVEEKPFSTLFYDYSKDKIKPVSFRIWQMLEWAQGLLSRMPELDERGKRELRKAVLGEYSDQVAALGEESMWTILERRVKVAFLIDSDGGDTGTLDTYRRGAYYLMGNGGHSEAFVTGHANSSGFELMAAAKVISLLRQSSLMWHFSDKEGDRRKTVESLREHWRKDFPKKDELSDLYGFLKRSPRFSKKMKWAFYKKIVDPKNLEGELEFTSEELQTLGIVDYVHDRVADMSSDFADYFGLASNKRVKDFWLYSYIMEKEAEASGEWKEKNFEGRRQELGKRKIRGRKRLYQKLDLT